MTQLLPMQEGSWRHVCGLFLHTKIPEVQFWCLQTLHEVMQYRVAVLAPEDLAELRGFLVALVTEKLPTAQFPVFIVNKIAQIYAALLRNEYPETWPDAVTVILGALNSGLAMIDVFLRILEAMDTDIISAEFHRSPADAAVSMRVKDALREQCIADVVSACFTILESYHASQPALGQMCLSVLARYIPWMDIGLVMNDKFVPAFYALLGRDDMVVQAAGCLTEMVLKKMEPAPKVLLLSNLVNKGIVEETLRAQQQRGQVGSEGMAAMAALVAAVCKELLVAGEKLAGSGGAEEASASALLGEMMPLLLSCASSDQDGVSIATMDFLTSYVNMLKRATRVAPEQVAQLAPILGVLQLKLTYPAEFDFENPGEAEEEFLEFRRDLSVLLKNIARISPDAAIAYVQRAIGTVLARLWEPQTPFGEVECVLTMLYELGEVIRLDEAPANPEVSMAAALAMVMSSNLGQYRHHSVQRAYLEIAHRYAKFLQMQQQHIPGVLQSFVQVVTSGSKLVRSKSCYNFLKVLRAIRGNLAVHVDALMEALLPHLVSTSLGDLEHQDRLYLFEAAGNILAADGLPPQDSARHLARVVTPLVERMEAVAERYVASGQSQGGAGAVALDGLGSDDFLNANIGVSLECIGWLSKGCPSLWQVPSSSEQLHRVLCVSTGVLSLLPSSGRLRSSALVYLHRMVDCLGTGMLPALPPALSHMLTSSGDDPKGITEVVTLVNQMLSKFKAGCEGLMLAIMPQLARAVLHNVNSNTALLRNQMSQVRRAPMPFCLWPHLPSRSLAGSRAPCRHRRGGSTGSCTKSGCNSCRQRGSCLCSTSSPPLTTVCPGASTTHPRQPAGALL